MSNPELAITPDQATEIFGSAELVQPEATKDRPLFTRHQVELQFGATTLGLEETEPVEGANLRVKGNTVPRLCDSGVECTVSVCGLGEVLMSDERRREQNCAAANTVPAFGGRPGFVITPTNNEAIFLGDPESHDAVTARDESGREQTMFNKVKPASTLVISEHEIPEDAENGIFVALNGADSSLGVATLEVAGTRYALVFCSSRPNLGDRSEDFQILRKGVDGVLDRHNITGEARERALNDMEIQIEVGYSASLENFAHRVQVPEITLPEDLQGANLARLSAEDKKRLDGRSRYALTLMLKNGLINPETGEITGRLTPKMIMNDQYPGALEHGEIYPEFEARHGIDAPYSDGGCPGDGQLCHVHYPKITERTLVGQLQGMGMQPENIRYNSANAVDPAAQDNRLASNRRFQLAGIGAERTPRTVNGVAVSFTPPLHHMSEAQFLDYRDRRYGRPEPTPTEDEIAAAAELLRQFPDTPEGNAAWDAYQEQRWNLK